MEEAEEVEELHLKLPPRLSVQELRCLSVWEGDSELGLEIDLGGGCKVQHVNTSYQGKYFQRLDNDSDDSGHLITVGVRQSEN